MINKLFVGIYVAAIVILEASGIPRCRAGGGWMCRGRGLDFDEYETAEGHAVQRLGHATKADFEPDAASEIGFISCFAE